MSGGVLIAGVGNIFFGDDGFGVEVARTLAADPPPDTEVTDYGIRGLHLTFRLLDPVRLLVIADTVSGGAEPGTVYTVQPDLAAGNLPDRPDAHSMNLAGVFANVQAMGGSMPRTFIVGCEPATLDQRIGLSPVVAAAVPRAVATIRSLVQGPRRPPARVHEQPRGTP